MNENIKKVLEAVSKDNSLATKIKNTSHEHIQALAADLGLPLSKEHIESNNVEMDPVNSDELEAVSGGKACTCVVGVGGKDYSYTDYPA